ncbi:phospholipase D family protein [Streptomyces angustmyceticus]|uniref:phospholipase D family protein n=1 Tax=Streptomyces angustmyceticus TaxID=285578 RepID=UPI003D921A2E
MTSDHVWRQIEDLLASARGRVALIAPFIKKDVFRAALAAITAPDAEILCVTRWSVLEVAAGVSDPEIAELASQDGRVTILLCHDLHAKLYLADDRCLVGSANLTAKATGRRHPKNLELLIETSVSHPEVQRLLEQIDVDGIPATQELASQIREQAELLKQDEDRPALILATGDADQQQTPWRPETRSPNRLYRVYRGAKHDYVSEILAGVIRDLAHLDVPPGLDEQAFSKAVRVRLYEMPEVGQLVTEGRLSMADLQQQLLHADGCTTPQAQRAAENIGEWLKYFDEVHVVPTGPWEIRQGRALG